MSNLKLQTLSRATSSPNSPSPPHLLLHLLLPLCSRAPHRPQLRLQFQQLLQASCINSWRAGRLALQLSLRLHQRLLQLLLPLCRLCRLPPLLRLLLLQPGRRQLVLSIIRPQQHLLVRKLSPQQVKLAAAERQLLGACGQGRQRGWVKGR